MRRPMHQGNVDLGRKVYNSEREGGRSEKTNIIDSLAVYILSFLCTSVLRVRTLNV